MDDKDLFLCETTTTFLVITHDQDCSIVTRELGIEPTRFQRKGDKNLTKFSPNPVIAQYGLWAFEKKSVGEGAKLAEHIEFFESLLLNRQATIERFRKDLKFECVFYCYLVTEDAGVGFDLNTKDIAFVHDVADRFTCSIVISKEIPLSVAV